MAALTANDPTFQPGFETVDTSITAGIGLGGYYGPLGGAEQPPTTPLAYVRSDAPAFFVIHGGNDTYTPVERARALVETLREASDNPVVYAELPRGPALVRPLPLRAFRDGHRRHRDVRRMGPQPGPTAGPGHAVEAIDTTRRHKSHERLHGDDASRPKPRLGSEAVRGGREAQS
jgi:acetyl esterase/lipase